MRKYLQHFSWLFILIIVLAGINVAMNAAKGGNTDSGYVRTNLTCKTAERVFDYADKLSSSEEEMLRKLIASEEDKCGCDIVVVTLNDPTVHNLMHYADDFYDDNNMGYDYAHGDGAIYVDNWATGDVWFSTSGRAERRYSDSMIRDIVDATCERTNANPYGAYSYFVQEFSKDMTHHFDTGSFGTFGMFVPLIVTIIYLVVNLMNNKGKKTTVSTTYVATGRPDLRVKQDIFLNKHTTHRTIESSSGGGGHHMSSGGFSHGGGGGHH